MNCVICNGILEEGAQFPIYFAFTRYSNTLLVNFITKVLNCDFRNFTSHYICKECFNIFEELDFTEITSKRLRNQILERCMLKGFENFMKEASCQTDDVESFEKENLSAQILSFDSIKREEENVDTLAEIIVSKTRSTRKQTKVSETQKKNYECSVCQKRFASKNGMVLHTQRQHRNETSTTDNTPASNTTTSNNVKLECDVLIDDHNILIDDCTKSEVESQCESTLLDDKSSVTSKSINNCNSKKRSKKRNSCRIIKPLKYPCPQCPKMWRTMGELRSHIASHSNLRPYICEVCGQVYKHKTALDIHVGMHNGINPFVCTYCHKAFTQKGALQRHLPIHTGDAPYQCDMCGKRFVHHTSFNMHTLAHTGQKSYKCNVCGLALLSGSHLKRHMRVHTGERPYSCAQCGKRFAERYNLAAHQKLHDAGPSELSKRLHRCQLCGAGFDRRPKLEEHLSNNHNKIAENDPSRKWFGHFLSNT